MDVKDDPMGDEEAAAMSRVEHFASWEVSFRNAAASYGMAYEDFKEEALAFIETYRKMNPDHNVTLQNLIVIPKPNPDILREKLAKFAKTSPAVDMEALSRRIKPSPKFMIPSS